ncbi:unnamed protein product [Bursaphelenchus okinawaensis]|uniref:Uncharacterized protein n=1 Tax=Bursaphelenchus okinawaensis TaxID=465554 RepID=A0A811L4J9_9BILA|nr:unnamed protein product [Bursaphelenchus okinawaensis]CAG9119570.1 unnamed protein product [Bursaphelenchus okinawaensis]
MYPISLYLIISLCHTIVLSCQSGVPVFKGADVEAKQLQDDPQMRVMATVRPADALTFNTVTFPPMPTLPTLPSLSDIFKLPSPVTLKVDNSIPEASTVARVSDSSTVPASTVVIPTVFPTLIPNLPSFATVNNNVLNKVNPEVIDNIVSDSKPDVADDDISSSGNGTNDEDVNSAVSEITSTVPSSTTSTEASSTTEEPKQDCSRATVTAITLMPFNDHLVVVDKERINQQIILLESYTQTKFDSFGTYTQEAVNIDGQFSLEFRIKDVKSCADLRDYATKAVSYSREIERILFTCHCEPMWIIAKRRSG